MENTSATHPQVVEFCELKGNDFINEDIYICSKKELETLMSLPKYINKTVQEIFNSEFC